MSFGGRISKFIKECKILTNDQVLFGFIRGVTFEFHETPQQKLVYGEYKFDEVTCLSIDQEIKSFVNRGIIEPFTDEPGQIFSNIFCRKKKSGKLKIIGNSQDLIAQIIYRKIKQTTVDAVLELVTPLCFMNSIDLKDAYYCLKIDPKFRKFVKFKWKKQLYQFTCMGNGI